MPASREIAERRPLRVSRGKVEAVEKATSSGEGREATVTDEGLRRIRRDFPYLERCAYLNSAGAGLSWRGQAAAAGQYYSAAASMGSDGRFVWESRAVSARERVSRLLDVPVDEVAFFRNTTEVINLVAHSLVWHPGDEVVVAADDFPSLVFPWSVAEAAGGRIVRVDPVREELREERLLEALGPRTRVLAVSHVHTVTGTRLDLSRLGRACREVGCLLVVDGIQALGSFAVDLSYVDVYASAVFKWLLSGFGVGIGVFRTRARSKLSPAYRGYRNPPPDQGFEYADPNYPGLYVLDSTLEYLEELGWSWIFGRVTELSEHLVHSLHRLDIPMTTPGHARGGIVSFRAVEAGAVVSELRREHVCVVEKGELVRVSPHFYNSREEVDRLADALETRHTALK